MVSREEAKVAKEQAESGGANGPKNDTAGWPEETEKWLEANTGKFNS
jgi:hypothetical protein